MGSVLDELLLSFNEVLPDIIEILLESTENVITEELLISLLELQSIPALYCIKDDLRLKTLLKEIENKQDVGRSNRKERKKEKVNRDFINKESLYTVDVEPKDDDKNNDNRFEESSGSRNNKNINVNNIDIKYHGSESIKEKKEFDIDGKINVKKEDERFVTQKETTIIDHSNRTNLLEENKPTLPSSLINPESSFSLYSLKFSQHFPVSLVVGGTIIFVQPKMEEEEIEVELEKGLKRSEELLKNNESSPCSEKNNLQQEPQPKFYFVEDPLGKVHSVRSIFVVKTFGVHKLYFEKSPAPPATTTEISLGSTYSQSEDVPSSAFFRKNSSLSVAFFAESITFRYGKALEDVFDNYFWGWTGEWTDELEMAVLNLCVCVNEHLNDDLSPFFGKMIKSFSSTTSSSTSKDEEDSDEFSTMIKNLQQNFADLLERQDATAMGRLHQTLYQFVEGGFSFLPLPEVFKDAILEFEQVKFKHSLQSRFFDALKVLVDRLNSYILQSQLVQGSSTTRDIDNLGLLSSNLRGTNSIQDKDHNNDFDLKILRKLRPSPLNSLFSTPQPNDTFSLSYLPTLPYNQVLESNVDDLVTRYSETLVGDCCLLGSILGFRIRPAQSTEEEKERDKLVLNNLLFSGFGYVMSSGNSLMPLLGLKRAVLALESGVYSNGFPFTSSSRPSICGSNTKNLKNQPLNIRCPKKLQSKRKDLSRIVRNKLSGDGGLILSLSVNTHLELACQKLNDHHHDNWVGKDLMDLWNSMMKEGSFLVFELWLNNELVAADFGHIVGTGVSFYVCTRFFDSNFRKLQLGFILAYVVSYVLQKRGVKMIDYGPTDLSPMMAYKTSVAEIVPGPIYLKQFRDMKESSSVNVLGSFTPGLLIERISEDHLFQL